MKNQNIYCKSGIEVKQLKARRELLKDGIELQLLSDFVEEPKEISEYIQMMGEDVKSIRVVHVPLKSGEEIVEVQMLSERGYQDIFNRICALSQHIAQINKQDILIVIHNTWSLSEYESQIRTYKEIKSFLRKILVEYPNIKVGIENVVPYVHKQGVFRNGVMPSYVDVIKKLRSDLRTERIGSVLDTCHAMVSIRTIDLISKYSGYEIAVTIEDYYKANEGVCMLVHLCDVERLGYNKFEHGTGFDDKNRDTLSNLMMLHEKYIPGVDITLEVIEKDYTDCVNYKKSREIVKGITEVALV